MSYVLQAKAAIVRDLKCKRTSWLHAQVIGHSVGTWNAFEFLMLARSEGVPMPRHLFLSAMAAPDIPVEQRPWKRQRSLSEADFKVCAFP